MNPGFRFFDHAADVGIEIRANSLEGLFETAARALMDWIGPAPTGARPSEVRIRVAAENLEELLVRWLHELLFTFHHKHLYPTLIRRIQLGENTLESTVEAVTWTDRDVAEFREVKAITYHQLEIKSEGSEWMARVILDV